MAGNLRDSASLPPTINARRTTGATIFATSGSACAARCRAARLPIFGIAIAKTSSSPAASVAGVFRLSLSWARLEPEPGVWSDEAFAHYRDVLQAIRDAGMSAMVTLVHNTWPLHVQAAGNGPDRSIRAFPDRVARFASEVAQRLGDLIDDYVTLNEPNQLVYGWIKGFWMRAYAMPPGQPPYAERRRADGRRADAHSQSLSRAVQSARRDSRAFGRTRASARIRSSWACRDGCSAGSIATPRTCSRRRMRSGKRRASRNRRSLKAAASTARSRSSR